MKKILLLLTLGMSLISFGQCQLTGSFTYSVNGNYITFNNTSTNEPPGVQYFWNYGNQFSSLENPTFTYLSTDEYACFDVYDTLNSCADSVCTFIPGNTLCQLNVAFNYTASNGTVSAIGSLNNAFNNTTSYWTYNGQTSTSLTPSFAWASTPQDLCFYVSDSANGCYDFVCQTVMPDSTACNLIASFAHYTAGGMVYITNTSSNVLPGTSYYWAYNGQTSTLASPTFTQAATDQYVYLSVTDSSGLCSDSLFVLILGTANTACTIVANINYTSNSGILSLLNASTNVPSNSYYMWTYGTQNSYLENPVFTHDTLDEWVCLTVMENNNLCGDSICVLIPGDTSGTTISLPNITSSMQLHSDDEISATIYPNPVKEQLNIQFIGAFKVYQITIADALGRTVFYAQTSDETNSYNLDVSHLENGIYLMVVKSGDENKNFITKKFIKE